MTRIAQCVALLALLAAANPATAAVAFTCSMSGEVSGSCCCAPASDDGCPAIERACQCCEVSLVQGTEPASPAVTHGGTPQVALGCAGFAPVDFATTDLGTVYSVRREPVRARSAPFYIVYGCLLR